MRIIMFEKYELPAKAADYGWSPYTVGVINQIIQEWYDSDLAQSILLAFKKNNRDLHGFMPIIPIDEEKRPKVEDKKSEHGEANIIGFEPYPLEGSKLEDGDGRIIAKIIDYWPGNEYWSEDVLYRIGDHKNNQIFDIKAPITTEAIGFGRDRIKAVEDVTGKAPLHLVAAVEAMQKELEAEK